MSRMPANTIFPNDSLNKIFYRSRGFGFITFKNAESVDAVQANRPHEIDGRSTETKRAMPREVNMSPGLEVIDLEFILNLRIKSNDWLLADTCPQAANRYAYFEFETVLQFYNLETRSPDKSVYWKIVLTSQPKHMLWVLKRIVSIRRFF